MMKRFLNILWLGVVVFSLSACQKYLEVQSNYGLAVPSSLDDLQKLLDDSQIMNLKFPSFGEASADNYYLSQSAYDALIDYGQQTYIWQNDHMNFGNDWSSSYNTVYNSNLVLDRIKKSNRNEGNANQYDAIYASAKFYRASQYLALLWTYSKAYTQESKTDMGIVLRNSPDFHEQSYRSSIAECYEKVITDLKESSLMLPEKTSHVMRPNKYAAYATLARAYLSMQVYDSAYYYVDLALKYNADLLDFNNLSEVKMTASYPFTIFNKETLFYAELLVSINLTSSRALTDTLLYRSYESNDLRRSAYFKVAADGTTTFKGSYAGSSKMFSGIAMDELYLMRAECNVRMGNVEAGMADLNHLLGYRYKAGTFIPYVIKDKREALALILKERRKELLYRGLRWMDLKRLNAEGGEISITRKLNGQLIALQPNSNAYALPLPEDIIRLTGMQQNPK
ncbi:RagB/SusD family nutrient uptake outer membrane protein [Sphingobacterium paramultivorum]|uniref:RagB/SusD family nutrient uptake outer membrane protein n=1 Tax=Sphingobacterium paramultivorum TaxID=2886510 RepID=UPI00129C4F4A|nr:RagB/SusD family nutrient uptake outer membrane protein [Sphingobacterium paramultivorum]